MNNGEQNKLLLWDLLNMDGECNGLTPGEQVSRKGLPTLHKDRYRHVNRHPWRYRKFFYQALNHLFSLCTFSVDNIVCNCTRAAEALDFKEKISAA